MIKRPSNHIASRPAWSLAAFTFPSPLSLAASYSYSAPVDRPRVRAILSLAPPYLSIGICTAMWDIVVTTEPHMTREIATEES